jgi:hypothetical protein
MRFAGRMSGQGTRGTDAASAVVWFVGISQGLVPLVVAGVFDRDSRFALPLLLPAPWWWMACLAVLVLAVVALLLLDAAEERAASGPAAPPTDHDGEAVHEKAAAGYDALSGLVLLIGIYNGLAPFIARLVFDGDLFLAFTLRLPAPWWWLASLAVLALTVVLLEWIDRAKQRATRAG